LAMSTGRQAQFLRKHAWITVTRWVAWSMNLCVLGCALRWRIPTFALRSCRDRGVDNILSVMDAWMAKRLQEENI
jgi:hypothetical protein